MRDIRPVKSEKISEVRRDTKGLKKMTNKLLKVFRKSFIFFFIFFT